MKSFPVAAPITRPGIARRLLVCALALSLPLSAMAVIYKSVAPDGQVVYSDEPQAGATEIKVAPGPVEPAGASITSGPVLLPPQPVPSLPATELPVAPALATTVTAQTQVLAEFAGYEKFTIVRPQDDSSVRVNNGDVEVELLLEPGLFVQGGHKIALLLDGKLLLADQLTPVVTLPNVDRGTHLLQAEVMDVKGEVIATSEGVTFTLQRFSAGSIPGNNPLLAPRGAMVNRPGALIAPRAQ